MNAKPPDTRNGYTTRSRFAAGAPVPEWVLAVYPRPYHRFLTFANDVVVDCHYPARRVDIYPTVHPAFTPDFQPQELFAFQAPPNCPRIIFGRPRRSRSRGVLHADTAPGEPMSPGAMTLDEFAAMSTNEESR